jgi:hypothetical protein
VRVLFDQATPVPLRRFLQEPAVRTAAQEGWQQPQNGELLNVAEAAGFDVLITTDKNLRYQQNLTSRQIAIIVLSKQQWPHLQAHAELVVAAVNVAHPGTYTEVENSIRLAKKPVKTTIDRWNYFVESQSRRSDLVMHSQCARWVPERMARGEPIAHNQPSTAYEPAES